MKALVIGGTGPTGPYVVEGLLKRGYEVNLLHRGTHEVDSPSEVEHIHGDPHFEDTLQQALGDRKFDVVIALYGRLRYIAKVLKGRTPRLISVGGGGVYQGWNRLDLEFEESLPIPVPEDAPLQNDPEKDMFTYRMVVTENEVMKAHREGHYNVTHFRYPTIYGPRQLAPRELSIVRRILDKRERLIITNGGSTIRSAGYAENMAYALLLAVDKPGESAGQIYNVREDKLMTNKEWISAICKLMNYRFEFVEMPYSLGMPAWIYSWGHQHHVMDITKVKTQLGYRDIVPFEKSIDLTIKWQLENCPLSGSTIEKQLRDPFDYQLEDKLMDEFLEASQRIHKLQPPRMGFHHAYDHPQEPAKKAKGAG